MAESFNGLEVFDATRPFHLTEEFPKVARTLEELRPQVVGKYRSILLFPSV